MMHLRYLRYLVRHRWFVMLECWKRGLYWRGLVHDLSKFLPSEWFAYARHFYGPKPQADADGIIWTTNADSMADAAFDLAWMRHQRRNDHHWQAFVLREDSPCEWLIQGSDLGPFHLGTNHAGQEITLPEVPGDDGLRQKQWMRAKHMRDALETSGVLARKYLPMSPAARTEMLCDWIGAGRAINGTGGAGETARWYGKHKSQVELHPQTQRWVEKELAVTVETAVVGWE